MSQEWLSNLVHQNDKSYSEEEMKPYLQYMQETGLRQVLATTITKLLTKQNLPKNPLPFLIDDIEHHQQK